MDKNGNIRINYDLWKTGIASHPVVGMGDIVNVDIFDRIGIAKIDFAPTEISNSQLGSGVIPTCCAIMNTTTAAGIAVIGTDDADAHTYNGTTFSAAFDDTAGKFQSAVSWKDFIIFSDHDVNSKTLELSSFKFSGNTVNQGFVSMTSNILEVGQGDNRFLRGHITTGIDDLVYVGAGVFVGSLLEKAGQTFDSATAGTYTWTPEALDITTGFEVDGLSSLTDFLMISAGTPDTRQQQIFPWDRVSSSFSFPTILNEGVAIPMMTKDNLTYFMNGIRGKLSVTNRSLVSSVVDFDNLDVSTADSGLAFSPNTIASIDDVFYIGISNKNSNTTPVGVYKVKGRAYTRLTPSNDKDGSDSVFRTYFTTVFEYTNLLVGWFNNPDSGSDTYGVDEYGKNSHRYTSYKAKIDSPLFTVGGSLDKRSYSQLEYSLAKDLTTGQGVRVSFRENLTDSFTLVDTFDFATHGALAQRNVTAKITDVSTLQIRVELTTGSSSTTTPELIEIRIF